MIANMRITHFLSKATYIAVLYKNVGICTKKLFQDPEKEPKDSKLILLETTGWFQHTEIFKYYLL